MTSRIRIRPLAILGAVLAVASAGRIAGLGRGHGLLASSAAPRVLAAPANNTAQGLPFSQSWSITNQITTDDDWSGVPGIIGYRGDALTSATGIDPQTVLVDGSATPLDVNANRADPDTFTSGGVTEFDGIANPGVALQGSGTARAPHLVFHLDATVCTNIAVQYNLRDIDGSADNAVQPVALQFRVGAAGDYANLPAGFVADASTGPSQATLVTLVNVTLPAAANNQPLVFVRVITTDAAGSDEWIAVDDISVTGTCAGPSPTTGPSPTPSNTPTPSPTPPPAPRVSALGPGFVTVLQPEAGFTGKVRVTQAGTTVSLPNVIVGEAADPCATGQLGLTVTVSNTGNLGVLDNAAFPELRIDLPGNLSATGCTSSVGTCALGGGAVTAHFALPVGQSVTVRVNVQFVGGLPAAVDGGPNATLNASACAIWDLNGNGTIDPAESDCSNATAPVQVSTSTIVVTCKQAVHPNDQLGNQVHLPLLNYEGQANVCQTWIEVQQIGCEKAKAALVVWGAPGFCPPQAAGPLKVECTGILKPGSSWQLLGAQVPIGAKSGMLFKFTARQLYEIGIDLGFDDVAADFMCETLFFSVVGDNDSYRRFKKAYNEGLDYAGIPLDVATGGGALAVDVLRKCPGDVTPGVSVTSSYDGIAGSHLGIYDEDFGGYGYYVPLVYATKGGAAGTTQGAFNSVIYVQNGGLECSSIEVWFRAQDDCLRNILCEISTLAPGETFQLDASTCVGPDWQGSAWVRASEPLGIAVDIMGRDVLMTYVGEPAEINNTFDPNKADFTPGDQVAFGPLVYSEYQGWDSGVQVQNLSRVVSAKVKVYFLDRSGDVVTTLVDWICPSGSQTFFLPLIASLPGTWVGSVRVESQEWVAPGSPLVMWPNIVAVATLVRYSDAARTDAREAIAYNLLPEHKIYDWQVGSAGGGADSGVGLVAIPSLMKDLADGGSGMATEIAVANVVPKPGFTDLAIFFYDQNGFLDYICEKLNDRQVEYINLESWGYLPPRFKGSAIISATFWEHNVFDGGGRFVRNLVGLGAVVVQRSGTNLGDDVPGDESAGDRGIPFELPDLAGRQCAFALSASRVPLCPGLPDDRVKTRCSKSRLTVKCSDCPQDIPDGGGNFPTITVPAQSIIDVQTPDGCTVADVNVWLSIFHNDIDQLDAALSSPAGTPVELFTDICGAGRVTGNVGVILDDDVTKPIWEPGRGCDELEDFRRYNIENPAAPPTLAAFEGQDPNGPWTLNVVDDTTNDLGRLLYWELQFELK